MLKSKIAYLAGLIKSLKVLRTYTNLNPNDLNQRNVTNLPAWSENILTRGVARLNESRDGLACGTTTRLAIFKFQQENNENNEKI